MASSKQREKLKLLEVLEGEESIFDDVEVEAGTENEDFRRVTTTAKSPLHLLLMVRHPDFPLRAGDRLYVNTTSASSVDTGEITIRSDARLETRDGIRPSLASAAAVYMQHVYGARPSSAPNGWAVVRLPGIRPGSYVALNDVFVEHYTKFGLDLDVLLDEAELEKWMIEHGYVTAVEAPEYRTSGARKRNAR